MDAEKKEKKSLKLFGRIHVFDLIVVLLLVVVILGTVNKLTGGNLISSLTGDRDVRVRVVFQTVEYPVEALKSINIGDKLAENKQYLDGNIMDVEIIDNMVSHQDETGEMVYGKDPAYSLARVTIEATAKYGGAVYSFGKQEFVPGSFLFLTTTNINLKGTVVECSEIKK